MKASRLHRPTLWCRVTDRYGFIDEKDENDKEFGVIAEVEDGDGTRRGIANRMKRWWMRRARLHLQTCAFCQAKRHEWERLSEELRRIERVDAPASLHVEVMKRIAHDQARNGERASGTAAVATREPGRFNLLIVLLAPVLSWCWIVFTIPSLFAGLYHAVVEIVLTWNHAISEWMIFAHLISPVAMSHAQFYVDTLYWGLLGAGITLVVTSVTRSLMDT